MMYIYFSSVYLSCLIDKRQWLIALQFQKLENMLEVFLAAIKPRESKTCFWSFTVTCHLFFLKPDYSNSANMHIQQPDALRLVTLIPIGEWSTLFKFNLMKNEFVYLVPLDKMYLKLTSLSQDPPCNISYFSLCVCLLIGTAFWFLFCIQRFYGLVMWCSSK